MKLLAIETATDACSAALSIEGEILERFEITPRGHTERILPMIDELLAEAGVTIGQMEALAFGRGPGAFTGVRIAVGVAQGIAFAADLPVVAVSTLAALAQGIGAQGIGAQGVDGEQVLAALDARMDEVYWGAYRRNAAGLMELVGEECVSSPSEVPLPVGEGWQGAGPGWSAYEGQLTARCGNRVDTWDGTALPHARDVALLGVAGFHAGLSVSAEQALPVYLRDKVTWKKIR
jgi:tRNA threonylcarbamoyladenosine biosynthesis protein TsaB